MGRSRRIGMSFELGCVRWTELNPCSNDIYFSKIAYENY